MIILIAALSTNNALGKNNQLLWHLPDDFKHFKTLTSGHFIVMGRKTFETFPKPLPNRTHIIITRNKKYKAPEGCFIAENIAQALELCPKNEDIYIIGGGEIYNQSIQIADKLELTFVNETFEADTFFPEIDPKLWQIVAEKHHPKDEKHIVDFTFKTFIRKK